MPALLAALTVARMLRAGSAGCRRLVWPWAVLLVVAVAAVVFLLWPGGGPPSVTGRSHQLTRHGFGRNARLIAMTVPAKTRSYRSPRRQEQAAATRRSVVRAARELFTRDGYAATTVTAVAAAAHVSLDTVYASVGRKPELVLAVIDGVLGSSDEPVGVEEREYVKAIRRTPSARGKIEVYAAAVGRLVPQIAPLEDALRRAAESDAECAAVWARMLERAVGEHHAARRGAAGHR